MLKLPTDEVALTALARLLALVTSREPLAVVLDELLRFSEQVTPDMRCSILLADLASGVLLSGAAPSLPVAYTRAIDNLPIREGLGSCGTAAARRETVIVSDIAKSPLWSGYTDLAAEHGLGACWSVPLIDSSGTLLGTCAMYYSRPRAPTPTEEDSIRVTGSLAALVIQRHRDAEQLRASEARYRQLAETCPDAILVHREGRVMYANRAAGVLLGVASPLDLVGQRLEEFVSAEHRGQLLVPQDGLIASRLLRSDGSYVNVEIASSQMSMDEQTVTHMVCRDVTERLALEDELMEAASREQARLAHDLHDGLGQQLTGIGLFILGVSNRVVPQLPAVAEDFETINALVSKSIEETRRLAHGMSPIAIERMGLAGGLAALAAQARELHGLQVTLEITPLHHAAIDSRVANHLYRIAQEALSNVVRHAQATSLAISAQIQDSKLHLRIADNGVGLAESSPVRGDAGGLGLRIMRYRAQRISGSLQIDRGSSRGTVIRVRCPLGDGKAVAVPRTQMLAHR